MPTSAINLNAVVDTGLEKLAVMILIALVILIIGNYVFKRWAVPFLTSKSAKNMDTQYKQAREVCLKAEENETGMDVLLRNLDYQFSHVITIDKKESQTCLKQ